MTDKFMYKVKINDNQKLILEEIIGWCTNYIGSENINWHWSYSHEHPFDYTIYFHFIKSKDSSFFILKWL